MLAVKTGMRPEYDIACKAFVGAQVLTGIQTLEDLQLHVSPQVTAIASFGMCGGLRPLLPVVGQTVVATRLIGPDGEVYKCDKAWRVRLHTQTNYLAQPYYSSGRFNESNTPEQRAAIYARTGAWCMDDESLFVAQFAALKHIPFVIMRNVSDQWNDDTSLAANLLTPDGNVNPFAVLWDIAVNSSQMFKMWHDYNICSHALGEAAILVGAGFCAP